MSNAIFSFLDWSKELDCNNLLASCILGFCPTTIWWILTFNKRKHESKKIEFDNLLWRSTIYPIFNVNDNSLSIKHTYDHTKFENVKFEKLSFISFLNNNKEWKSERRNIKTVQLDNFTTEVTFNFKLDGLILPCDTTFIYFYYLDDKPGTLEVDKMIIIPR